MDPNELLPIVRTEFQKAFLESLEEAFPRSVEALFKKAESAYSSVEQTHYLHACNILRKSSELLEQMRASMESLLTRSFQTTYNTFRPVSALSLNSNNLSLVDTHVFDDELLLNEITDKFRIEASDQIRDLNIRIAILFAQDTIRERENPFRPYLLARSISNTLDAKQLERALCNILETQIAEDFSAHVLTIYEKVNECMAAHGIAAELQFRFKKSPQSANASGSGASTGVTDEDNSIESNAQGQQPYAHGGSQPIDQPTPASDIVDIGGKFYSTSDREFSTDQPPNRIEQLVRAVRHLASGLGNGRGRPAATRMQNVSGETAFSPLSQPHAAKFEGSDSGFSADQGGGVSQTNMRRQQFSWLGQHQSIGKVLRQVFSGRTTENQHRGALIQGTTDAAPIDALASTTETEMLSGAEVITDAMIGSEVPVSGMEASSQAPYVHGAGNGEYQEVPRQSHSGIVQSVHQLQRSHTASTEHMFDPLGRIRNLILEQREQLNDMTDDVDEQMTIDVVAMLFEFILSDNQVPAEIRAQLGRLQFLVLKIALRDQSLLTQKGHPARLLINRVGTISLGLKQIDPSGVHITQEICRIVETLLEDESENSQLFSRMLDEFDAFIARELRSNDKQTADTIEAVEEVQNRTLRIVHIAAQLQEIIQKLTINPFLREFLENTWVSAIELVERTDTKRGTRYRLLVPDLLWSIVPKAADEDRTQLFALLPIILSTIREALGLLQCDQAYQKRLLDWLVDAHTAALRTAKSDVPSRTLSLPSIHHHFHPFIYPADVGIEVMFNETKHPEIQERLDKAIRELDIQVEMLDQLCNNELTSTAASTVNADVAANEVTPEMIKERLRTGVSLELHLGFKPSTGKLSWVDPQLRNLVLSLEGHSKPSLVSVRMFRRMIAHGRVRFLEAEPLFERAVQALLTSADVIEQPEAA